MVFCPYCGQQFTRDEHLERHILTHTNVKPFRCLTCHMSFARRDLLQRHYTVHGRDQNQQEIPAANGMIPKSAGRTPIACVNCAKTKTRCDKKFPCSRCASRNLECTLRSTRRATKNAQRMELPPDGTVAAPPHHNLQQPVQVGAQGTANITPPKESKSHSPRASAPAHPTGAVQPLDGPVLQQSHAEAVHHTHNPDQFKSRAQSQASNAIPHLPTDPYSQSVPFPGQEEFTAFGDASDDGTSPHFMIDWIQLQLPMDFAPMNQSGMLLNADMPLDYHGYEFATSPDMMLPMMPDTNGPLLTPIESPETARCPKFDPTTKHIRRSPSDAMALTPPGAGLETTAFVTAQDSWSVFRCGPIQSSNDCPQTALLNLELLEQTLRDHEAWLSWRPRSLKSDTSDDYLTVMQLHESTRDKLLAITQSFLHKALEIHRDGSTHFTSQTGGLPSPRSHSGSSFVLLPPARVLECFLRSYANCYERYFPISSRGTLDVNELMHCQNDRAASLLVLIMMAQGATNLPSREARMLTGGLIEACRISLFDLVERNIVMRGDPLVLQAALLFTVQAAWSGDNWQMDIAMGQRGMYLAMLRHSGLLGAAAATINSPQTQTIDRLWADWAQNERRSRLVYSWVMADQELALLHDTAPLVAVNELVLPMPDADRLWQAKSAVEWSTVFEQVHEFAGRSSIGSGARPCSLKELFGRFLDGDMVTLGLQMTALQLRLLLQPLQLLISQQTQLIDCLPSKSSSLNPEPCQFDATAARARLEGMRGLLKRWYELAQQYLEANALCTVMQTSLAIFHLINLNAVTNFGEIESLARRESFDGSYPQLQWRHSRCIQDVEEAIFHCGQLMRHIRAMHHDVRPPWWAGAIYRAGLVLWTDSLLTKYGAPQNINGMCPVPGPSLSIDTLPADHALILRYLTKREGVPCVTKRDGSQMNIDNAFNVLQHCVQLIDEGNPTRFTDGIRSKLDGLSRR